MISRGGGGGLQNRKKAASLKILQLIEQVAQFVFHSRQLHFPFGV